MRRNGMRSVLDQSSLLHRHLTQHYQNPVKPLSYGGGGGGHATLLWHVDASELEVEVGQEVLGVVVDLDALRVDGRDLRHVVHAALTLLLLELERDAAHWAVGNTLHQVRDVTRDLVAHALGWDDGDFIADALVRVEVKRQTRVVLLDDLDGRALDGLGTDTHCYFLVYW